MLQHQSRELVQVGELPQGALVGGQVPLGGPSGCQGGAGRDRVEKGLVGRSEGTAGWDKQS